MPVGELSNGRTTTVLSKADCAPVLVVKRNTVLRAHGYQRLSEFFLDCLKGEEDVIHAQRALQDAAEPPRMGVRRPERPCSPWNLENPSSPRLGNAAAEGFFGRMKTESVYPEHWEEHTRDEVLALSTTASAGTTTSASNGHLVG